MGSPSGEADRHDDEGPRIEVRVEPFWMGVTEITWDEYEVFMFSLDIERRAKGAEAGQVDIQWPEAKDVTARRAACRPAEARQQRTHH